VNHIGEVVAGIYVLNGKGDNGCDGKERLKERNHGTQEERRK
jgi:hypothetical protein